MNEHIIKSAIGRVSVNMGDYDSNVIYKAKNRVYLYGCEWASLRDDNNTAPATFDGEETITPNTEDWKLVSGSTELWLYENGYKSITAEQTESSEDDGGRNVILIKAGGRVIGELILRNGHKGLPGRDGEDGRDGLTMRINLGGQLYEQEGGTITLPGYPSLSRYINDVGYDSENTRIVFYHNNTIVAYVDATPFIIDGMVKDVEVVDGNIVFTFNTDAGDKVIRIPTTRIFNPNNYYTKDQTEAWVTEQGYLTEHQSLAHLATKTSVQDVIDDLNDLAATVGTDREYAESVMEKANEAKEKADDANTKADEAKDKADEADTKAGGANTKADEAVRRAEALAEALGGTDENVALVIERVGSLSSTITNLTKADGRIALVEQKADDNESAISSLTEAGGRIALVEQKADDNETAISNLTKADGRIALVEQKADDNETAISNLTKAGGRIALVEQKADNIESSISAIVDSSSSEVTSRLLADMLASDDDVMAELKAEFATEVDEEAIASTVKSSIASDFEKASWELYTAYLKGKITTITNISEFVDEHEAEITSLATFGDNEGNITAESLATVLADSTEAVTVLSAKFKPTSQELENAVSQVLDASVEGASWSALVSQIGDDHEALGLITNRVEDIEGKSYVETSMIAGVKDSQGKITAASIIAAVNGDSSQVAISADKINLDGTTIAQRLLADSAIIGGFTIGENSLLASNGNSLNDVTLALGLNINGEQRDPYLRLTKQVGVDSYYGVELTADSLRFFDHYRRHTPTETTYNQLNLDGSGFLAKGKLSWNTDGNIGISSGGIVLDTSMISPWSHQDVGGLGALIIGKDESFTLDSTKEYNQSTGKYETTETYTYDSVKQLASAMGSAIVDASGLGITLFNPNPLDLGSIEDQEGISPINGVNHLYPNCRLHVLDGQSSSLGPNIYRGSVLNVEGAHLWVDKNFCCAEDATVFGKLTADEFVKFGGTSSQFLKADGSVDSNTYITRSPSYLDFAQSSGNEVEGYIYNDRVISHAGQIFTLDMVLPAGRWTYAFNLIGDEGVWNGDGSTTITIRNRDNNTIISPISSGIDTQDTHNGASRYWLSFYLPEMTKVRIELDDPAGATLYLSRPSLNMGYNRMKISA